MIETLRKIRNDFNDNAEKQTAACRSLIDPRTGGIAWDILELAPGRAIPAPSDEHPPYLYEEKSDSWVMRDDKGRATVWKKPWFTEASHMCAIPRAIPACAPTVEFLGICEHSQVVNYLQWNFMLNLCGGVYPYAGPVLRKAWNLKQYGTTAPNETQEHMSEIAEQIFDRLEDNPDEIDFSEIKEALQGLDAGLDQKPIRECELTCKVKIDTPFDYRWIGLSRGRPYQDFAARSRRGGRGQGCRRHAEGKGECCRPRQVQTRQSSG